MGQTEFRLNMYNIDKITRQHFQVLQVIGKGGCGKVYKAFFKRNRKYVAIKEMSKKELFDKGMISIAFNEKIILSRINHDFIGNMYYSFQDKDNLYIILNLINGGDLRFYLNINKQFTEEQIKFFMACILTAIEYLQSKGVVHRDIKPENLICDDHGYLRLIDFGIARTITQETLSPDSSGTSGYIAPECLISNIISFDADYFSMGVVLYELCFGVRPYLSKTKHEMIDEFKYKEIRIDPKDLPKRFAKSQEMCDIMNQLLKIKPNERLGHNGLNKIKQHKWFHKFNWIELVSKTLISPFTPKISESIVFNKQSNYNYNNDEMLLKNKAEKIMENSVNDITNNNDDSFQSNFKNFTHNGLSFKSNEEKEKLKFKSILNQSQLNSLRYKKRLTQPKTYINLKHQYISNFSPMKYNIFKEIPTQKRIIQSLSVSKLNIPSQKNISTQEDSSIKFPLISLNSSERKISMFKEKKYDLFIPSKCLFKTRLRKDLLL